LALGSGPHVHLKDYDGMLWSREEGRRYLHPGQGRIDFPKVFRKLRHWEFSETMSLEASGMNREGVVDLVRVQQSLALLRRWMEDAAS
jgi:sugar phosphate isomerase/epimerase